MGARFLEAFLSLVFCGLFLFVTWKMISNDKLLGAAVCWGFAACTALHSAFQFGAGVRLALENDSR